MHRSLISSLALALMLPAAPASPQETPAALGSQFLQAVRSRDTTALRGLIHPASLRSVDADRLEQVIQAWLRLEPEPSWRTRSVAADSLNGYEPESRRYRLGPIEIDFPTAPERFLMVLFTRPLEPGSSATLTGEKTRDAIAPVDGRWHFVIGDVRRVPGAGRPIQRF